MDNEKLKSNITSSDHWIRLLFMILFALVLYVAGIVVGVLVLVQFLFALITGSDNTNLRQLGDSLTQYIAQTLRFLTYNSNDKPFPFADWPEPAPVAEVVEPEEVVTTSAEADKPDANGQNTDAAIIAEQDADESSSRPV
ncbi:DUF4389 domain-containing protein [uncultured Gilvimarinus sp.]|uniref:DUF4389 domain-containing protein n=1 Tax=uncultured Gilvimarinus sp. TaxID=1689143 RepID=UPI0030EDF26C